MFQGGTANKHHGPKTSLKAPTITPCSSAEFFYDPMFYFGYTHRRQECMVLMITELAVMVFHVYETMKFHRSAPFVDSQRTCIYIYDTVILARTTPISHVSGPGVHQQDAPTKPLPPGLFLALALHPPAWPPNAEHPSESSESLRTVAGTAYHRHIQTIYKALTLIS